MAGSARRLLAALLMMLGLGLGLGAPGAAQDRQGAAVQITPYVWATGVGGTFRPFAGAPELDIDRAFSDLIGDLDVAFFLSGLVRSGRFVLIGDVSYTSSSRSGAVSFPGIGAAPAEGRLRQTSATLASGYRVIDAPAGTLDLLAGARAWWVRADVDVAGGAVSRSPRVDFVDPILAARANVPLAPGWSAIAYGDVGGFGAGSEWTFQLLGTVNHQVTERVFLSAGYRHLEVDYRSGGTRIDMRMGGPLFGATLRF